MNPFVEPHGSGLAPERTAPEPAVALRDPARKAELIKRLRRAEGQVRGVQKLLEEGADCRAVAQQLLATRHALDSTFVRLHLSLAEQALGRRLDGEPDAPDPGEVFAQLQHRLGRGR